MASLLPTTPLLWSTRTTLLLWPRTTGCCVIGREGARRHRLVSTRPWSVNTLIVLVEADDDEGGADADAMAEDSEWEINLPSPSDMPREPPVEHAVTGPSVVRAQQVSLPGRGW